MFGCVLSAKVRSVSRCAGERGRGKESCMCVSGSE